MPGRRKSIEYALVAGIAVLLVVYVKINLRPVLQLIDSPEATYTARLFRLYDQGGPAPYGEEVTVSSAGDPLGRWTGATLWIGYCYEARISWKSASALELSCLPSRHADTKDVFVRSAHQGIAFHVARQ
jgi:hypothetical protein